jgi:hypothetical protein
MKLSTRLLVTTGTILLTMGAPVAVQVAGAHSADEHSGPARPADEHRWGYGDGYSHQNTGDDGMRRDYDNSRPPNCDDDHRWGPGDGYSNQNADDPALCARRGEHGAHEGEASGGGTAGGPAPGGGGGGGGGHGGMGY